MYYNVKNNYDDDGDVVGSEFGSGRASDLQPADSHGARRQHLQLEVPFARRHRVGLLQAVGAV